MEQLSGLDAMFVYAESQGMPMHVSTLSVYDPSTSEGECCDMAAVLRVYKETADRIPVLKSKLVELPYHLDQPYWQQSSDFDIHAHLHRVALPAPADWGELQKMLSHLHAQRLNRDLPLWEAYVIEGVGKAMSTSEKSFAIFLKVHHSIMDGATGMAIFSSLHTLTPYAEPIIDIHGEPADEQQPQLDDSSSLMRRALWNNSKRSVDFGRFLAKAVPAYKRIKAGLQQNKIKLLEGKPRTRFNQPISSLRSIDRLVTDFEDIRRIKHLVAGATVNEVALTLISGAMRAYLESKQELPEGSMVASVPINTRASGDAKNHGNVLSVMNVSLCSDIADPLVRLEKIHAASQSSKDFAEAMGSELLNDVCDVVYSGLASWGLKKASSSGLLSLIPPVNHTIVTNVSGPPIPFYMAGCKMVDSFGLGPLLPAMGPFHAITSSNGRFCISVTACGERMPDVDTYKDFMQQQFDLLLTAADQKESAARKEASAAKPAVKKAVANKKSVKKVALKKTSVKKVVATKEPLKKVATKKVKAVAKAGVKKNSAKKNITEKSAVKKRSVKKSAAKKAGLKTASNKVVDNKGGKGSSDSPLTAELVVDNAAKLALLPVEANVDSPVESLFSA